MNLLLFFVLVAILAAVFAQQPEKNSPQMFREQMEQHHKEMMASFASAHGRDQMKSPFFDPAHAQRFQPAMMDKQQNPGQYPNDPRMNRDHAAKMMNQHQNPGFGPNDPRMRDHALLNQPHGNPAHLLANDFRSEQLLSPEERFKRHQEEHNAILKEFGIDLVADPESGRNITPEIMMKVEQEMHRRHELSRDQQMRSIPLPPVGSKERDPTLMVSDKEGLRRDQPYNAGVVPTDPRMRQQFLQSQQYGNDFRSEQQLSPEERFKRHQEEHNAVLKEFGIDLVADPESGRKMTPEIMMKVQEELRRRHELSRDQQMRSIPLPPVGSKERDPTLMVSDEKFRHEQNMEQMRAAHQSVMHKASSAHHDMVQQLPVVPNIVNPNAQHHLNNFNVNAAKTISTAHLQQSKKTKETQTKSI